jgi:hypothetical protein
MALKERIIRADRMTVAMASDVIDDAIILHNPATDTYVLTSKEGRLPLEKRGSEFYYKDDGTPLKALRKYLVRLNPDHLP